MGNSKTLGSILVERGALSAEALDGALSEQRDGGRRLGEILVDQGLLGEEAIRWALAEQMDLPLVHPDPEALDPDALALLPAELCRRYGVLPLYLLPETGSTPETLTLAAADPSRQGLLAEVSTRAGRPLRVVAALREEIGEALDRVYGAGTPADVGIHSAHLATAETTAVMEDPTGSRLLHYLLEQVLADGEGGLHLRLRAGEAQVQDRRGALRFAGGETWHAILLDRLRQLAEIPSGNGAVLQRGRFRFARPEPDHPALFRVSLLRGVEGEEAQVQLIEWQGEGKTLAALGFGSPQALAVRQGLAKPGLVWVTSPGESGVGSTLFGLLREIPGEGSTFTMEEEVFYRSPGFLQIEALELEEGARREILRELKYLDFRRVLVDRVGPARLGDLLSLALRKRWVLAACAEASMRETLLSIAARAGDLPLYGLRLVVHQRLAPLLCTGCREPSVLGSAERQALRQRLPDPGSLYQEGEGCDRCHGHGVVGMRAFFEVLPVDVRVREALYAEARGERGVDRLLEGRKPSIASQLAAAVAAGEVSLSELWDVV